VDAEIVDTESVNLLIMSPLRQHIFVCFMAKSAFWGGFFGPSQGWWVKPLDSFTQFYPG